MLEAEKIYNYPEVKAVYLMSGSYDLSVLIEGKTMKEVAFFVSQKLAPIEEAIVTSGGIEIKEINPKTMESKLVRGLYFAGEIIDVDAYTGGFNLQIAFSTGHLAGKSAAESEF